MEEHRFVPGPARFRFKRRPKRILRPLRQAGSLTIRPDIDSLTFEQQLKKLGLSGSRASVSTQIFRDSIGQLARREPQSTMGISAKYLLHALDAGAIEECLEEVFGTDTSRPVVNIDLELTMIALDEAFEKISSAAKKQAKIIFASSRPASMLPLMIELTRLSQECGAEILYSYDNTSSFVADGRKDRQLTWCGQVGVVTDKNSLLATDDAKVADDLIFHLPRPDLVVADHIFAGAALTAGYPTVAFTSLDSVAVAVASVPEPSALAVPLSLNRPSSHYEVIADFARSYFE
ncbi:MAG: phosphatase [Acidimicrobiia bacterium]